MPSVNDLPQSSATASNFPLHYTEAGSGDTLLLIHGSLCDYRYWRWQLPELSQRYRIIAPSLRGYWPTALAKANPLFNIGQHAQDLAAFLAEVAGATPIHVLGHSRGAHVALELAYRAPAQVRSLTLADPGFAFVGEAPRPPFQSQAEARLMQGDIEAALAGFVDAVNGPGTWRQMVGWFKAMVRDNAYTLLSQAQEAPPAVDLERVASLTCPILLIGGDQSPARYASRLAALQDAWPQARRITIPQAAHGMNLANPRHFNRVVAEFLATA